MFGMLTVAYFFGRDSPTEPESNFWIHRRILAMHSLDSLPMKGFLDDERRVAAVAALAELNKDVSPNVRPGRRSGYASVEQLRLEIQAALFRNATQKEIWECLYRGGFTPLAFHTFLTWIRRTGMRTWKDLCRPLKHPDRKRMREVRMALANGDCVGEPDGSPQGA